MNKIRLTSSLILLLLSLNSFAETGVAPHPAAVKRGLSVFESNCQQCHQERGKGENIPPAIQKPGFLAAIPLDKNAHAWHHGDEQLVQIIQKGNQRMPAFGNVLSDAQLRDVVAYVKSLWEPRILKCQGPKHMSCM